MNCSTLSHAAPISTLPRLLGVALLGALLGALASASTASAQTVDESFPFELERWYRIEHTSGPVTIHRLRLTHTQGGFASRLKRDDRYQQQVTLELEFSNQGDADWKCQAEVEWLDEAGLVIEGVTSKLELDDRKQNDIRRESKVVLRYGLQRARTLHIKLRLDPD
ncbi:MAG TPA: hypothetical protein VMV46_09645 [Thermoanaerobaculia bacterium]|nr:hypothetical protein [Thermoanaerobaculia bacterium]